MSTERQRLLLLRMRRALVGLHMQTPEPLALRIPARIYLATVACFILLTAVVSTHAALLYRSDVQTLNTRVFYVQRVNFERQQARTAALLAYKQRQVLSKVPEPKKITAQVEIKAAVIERETPPKPMAVKADRSRVIISSLNSEIAPPSTIEGALDRLLVGRDDRALRWASEHGRELHLNRSWEQFRSQAAGSNLAERHYQVGVLYGAAGDYGKSRHWLRSALSISERARYLRAYAIASDRQGLQGSAIAAYRRYLLIPGAADFGDIQARLSVLEGL